MKKLCLICGEVFEPRKGGPPQVACSPICARARISQLRRDARQRRLRGEWQRGVSPATCPICGAVFHPYTRQQRCCSKGCQKEIKKDQDRMRYWNDRDRWVAENRQRGLARRADPTRREAYNAKRRGANRLWMRRWHADRRAVEQAQLFMAALSLAGGVRKVTATT